MANQAVANRDRNADHQAADREAEKRAYQQRIEKFRGQLDSQSEELRRALPAHMPMERFSRVLQTATIKDSKLLLADRTSFWMAAMQCAQDGLMPDGREAALVRYWNMQKKCEVVQYIPMVFGILKKVRNSGQIATITARVVHGGDKYRYWVDDEGEHILYEPSDDADTAVVRRVFAMARTKDGEVMVEPLSAADIEKIRQASKAKDKGPWVDWWDEMAKKTALRRLSKRLPMSTDLDDLLRRDEALYDFDKASDRANQVERPRGLADRLAALTNDPIDHDPETGEVREDEEKSAAPKTAKKSPQGDKAAAGGQSKGEGKPASRDDDAPQVDRTRQAAADDSDEGDAADDRRDDGDYDDRDDGQRDDASEQDDDASDGGYDEAKRRAKAAYDQGFAAGAAQKMKRAIPSDYGDPKNPTKGREEEWKAWMSGHAAGLENISHK